MKLHIQELFLYMNMSMCKCVQKHIHVHVWVRGRSQVSHLSSTIHVFIYFEKGPLFPEFH